MARVVVTELAAAQLRALVRGHSLPASTADRVRRSSGPLADSPELGAELGRSLAGRCFVLGPWRWMIIVYRSHPERDLVAVLAFVVGRTSTSPTGTR